MCGADDRQVRTVRRKGGNTLKPVQSAGSRRSRSELSPHEPSSRPSAAGVAARPSPWLGDVRSPLLVPLLLLLATRTLMFLAQPFASEDAYIAFRYAANLVAGHGLTFNPGERVMGFTSPLWTLWTAAGLVLHADAARWTQLTAIVADAGTLLIGVPLLVAAVSGAAAWTFALFFALWPLFAASAVSGLEMNAVLFLVVAAAALAERRSRWTGLVLGALAISRPEGLLVAMLVAWRADTRARLVAGALALVTALALWAYFHTLVPQSVLAKAALYGTPGPWTGRHWWDWLVPFPMGRYPTSSEGLALMPIGLVFLAALITGARRLWASRAHAVATIGVAGGLVWLVYGALGVAYFWWYMTLPLAALAWVAAAGLPGVVRGRLVPALCVAALLGAWIMALPLYLGRARAEYTNFMSVAQHLRAHARAGDSVLLEPIGMIGYGTPVRVLDEVGLVTPEAVRRRVAGAGWYADLVAEHRPAWLVTREETFQDPGGFAGRGAPFRDRGERDNVLAHYQLVWPTSAVPGITLRVLRRTD